MPAQHMISPATTDDNTIAETSTRAETRATTHSCLYSAICRRCAICPDDADAHAQRDVQRSTPLKAAKRGGGGTETIQPVASRCAGDSARRCECAPPQTTRHRCRGVIPQRRARRCAIMARDKPCCPQHVVVAPLLRVVPVQISDVRRLFFPSRDVCG